MDIEQMKAELQVLDEQVEAINAKRATLRQQIADAQATFKAGDLVTYEGAKWVWKIIKVRPGYGSEPKYIVSKLKKDGTPAMLENELFVPWKTQLVAAVVTSTATPQAATVGES